MPVSVQNVQLYDVTTTEDPMMPGFYYVDMRVKARVVTSSADCWITSVTATICDAGGAIDGPFEMNPDGSLGPNWYSSGVLSIWGILSPGDVINAHVDAWEECWSEDTADNDSTNETVPLPAAAAPPAPPPAPPPGKGNGKKKAGKKSSARKSASRKKSKE